MDDDGSMDWEEEVSDEEEDKILGFCHPHQQISWRCQATKGLDASAQQVY